MLIFNGFKCVFGYTSQTNVTRWRRFMKNCPAIILEKEKVILETKGKFSIYECILFNNLCYLFNVLPDIYLYYNNYYFL